MTYENNTTPMDRSALDDLSLSPQAGTTVASASAGTAHSESTTNGITTIICSYGITTIISPTTMTPASASAVVPPDPDPPKPNKTSVATRTTTSCHIIALATTATTKTAGTVDTSSDFLSVAKNPIFRLCSSDVITTPFSPIHTSHEHDDDDDAVAIIYAATRPMDFDDNIIVEDKEAAAKSTIMHCERAVHSTACAHVVAPRNMAAIIMAHDRSEFLDSIADPCIFEAANHKARHNKIHAAANVATASFSIAAPPLVSLASDAIVMVLKAAAVDFIHVNAMPTSTMPITCFPDFCWGR